MTGDFLRFVNWMKRPAVAGLVLAIAAGMWPLIKGDRFTIEAIISPFQDGGSGAGLASLAQGFGVDIGVGTGGAGTAFYAAVIGSPRVLKGAIAAAEASSTGPGYRTLEELGIGPLTPKAEATEQAAQRLKRRLSVRANQRAGLVVLTITAADTTVGVSLLAHVVSELQSVTQRMRQDRAAQEAVFSEARGNVLADSLDRAEQRMADFVSRNRDFRNAPGLVIEYDRLLRRVQFYSGLSSQAALASEEARVNATRATPAFALIQPPQAPTIPDSKHLLVRVILGFVLGSLSYLAVRATVPFWSEFVLKATRYLS